MANPVMNSIVKDWSTQQTTPAGYPAMPGYQPASQQAQNPYGGSTNPYAQGGADAQYGYATGSTEYAAQNTYPAPQGAPVYGLPQEQQGGYETSMDSYEAMLNAPAADAGAVAQPLSTLTNYIREDANSLDGYTGKAADKTTDSSGTSPWIAQFLPSLLVILREGMEAILVVAAVLAYLAKAGHKKKAPIVWGGVVLAFGLSIGLAFLFSYVTSLAGANQELLEGFAALFAVAMLIWVSNWMINKSSNKAWDEYIKKQTDASLSSGSLLGLAFISFLAVLREGAETILFYVPIVAAAGDKVHYVWIGLAVGLVALVIIYLLIQFAAVRIPLRPFFTITSLLMAFMAFTFTGSGIGELQEADVVSLTPISGFPTIDLLGIYPRVENLAAQAIVLAIIVGLYFFGKARLAREAAAQSRAGE